MKSVKSMSCLWKFTCCLSISFLIIVLVSTCYNNVLDRRTAVSWPPGKVPYLYDASVEELSCNPTCQILYLTQTEKCLSEYLKSPKVIGNATVCQCDVLVLSFKEECKDTSLPHVKYIFHSSTTWTTGRNRLYDAAKASDTFYLYYIFMDSDIKFRTADKTLSNKNLWRVFDDALRTIQPPVVTIDPIIKFNNISLKDCKPEYVTKFAQVFWFDGMFNAFHYQAIDHILPYSTRFDNISWFYSQMYVIIKSDLKFHGHVVGDSRILAQNTEHHPYPRECNWNTFAVVAKEVGNEVPKKYQNISETILKRWTKNFVHMASPGDFYCSRPLKPNAIRSYIPYGSIYEVTRI